MKATIVIPTFDHGPTLRFSVGSALAQTEHDIEIFVIGDGAPPSTHELVTEMRAKDPRVHFFENNKSPRTGEEYRHAALAHARGEVICYLGDDDLMLPDHVVTVRQVLAHCDFCSVLQGWIRPDGSIAAPAADIGMPYYRAEQLAYRNHLPLGAVAHTLAAYRRLPWGWRTTPDEHATDTYMWHQFLSQIWCRALTSMRMTMLKFPTRQRVGWTLQERGAELSRWSDALSDPAEIHRLKMELLAWVAHDRVEARIAVKAVQARLESSDGDRTGRASGP